jgi:hypothetical protein
MKNKYKLFSIIALAVLLAFSFTACEELFIQEIEGGEESGYINLDRTAITLFVGNTETITANSNKGVIWSSSNTNVATVSQSGTVTATGGGTAIITALTSDGKNYATCTVTVTTNVTGVNLNKTTLALDISRSSETLFASIYPNDAADKTVKWTSSNEFVAAVSYNGLVVALTPGTAVITVTTNDGSYSDSCSVSVSYGNFNPSNLIIVNNSGKPDSDVAKLKDIVLFTITVKEYEGDWMANYIRSNDISINLREMSALGSAGYRNLNVINLNAAFLDYYQMYSIPRMLGQTLTHEAMHIAQYKSSYVEFTNGRRYDVVFAAEMMQEFLAHYYNQFRHPDSVVTVDMPNAVELQSRYMILSIDPDAYKDELAKDPSLPPYISEMPWFKYYLSIYTVEILFNNTSYGVYSNVEPLRQSSKEDMIQIARILLECRDPKMAGVTDETLWIVFEALRKVWFTDSKYLDEDALAYFQNYWFNSYGNDTLQRWINEWEEDYAAQFQ